MNNRDKILTFVPDESVIFADGFDDAIIGLDTDSLRVIYSKQRMIEILEPQMGLDDAIEYLQYNTWSAYVGEQTPIYMDEIDVFDI